MNQRGLVVYFTLCELNTLGKRQNEGSHGHYILHGLGNTCPVQYLSWDTSPAEFSSVVAAQYPG